MRGAVKRRLMVARGWRWCTLAEWRRVRERRRMGRVSAVLRVVVVARWPKWRWPVRMLGPRPSAWWPAVVSHSVGTWEVLSAIDRPCCALDLVEQGSDNTFQAVALLDHGSAGLLGPSEGLGEATLLGKDLLLEFCHLPLQGIQLSHLGLDVQLFVIVAVGLRLVDGVNAGHGCRAFDIGDPHWGNLLEANGESDVLDLLTVDRANIQAEKLLLRRVVPSHAGKVPGGIHHSVVVDGKRATAPFRELLAVDGDIAITTGVRGFVNVEAKDNVLAGNGIV